MPLGEMTMDAEFIYCPNCKHPYVKGSAIFCAECGTHLSKSISPAQEIKQLEQEPRPYSALRFTSSLIIFFGWLYIIFGWIFSFTIVYGMIGQYLPPDRSPNLAGVIAFVLGSIHTLIGILLIAGGQFYQIALDIRDDMHITARIIRRFAILMSEK